MFRVNSCDSINEILDEGVNLRKRRVRVIQIWKEKTNLSIVRVCQKVRGTVDNVDLSFGIP